MMSSEEVQRDKKTTDRVLIQLLIVQNLECINMDVSSGYDQQSNLTSGLSSCTHIFELAQTCVLHREFWRIV